MSSSNKNLARTSSVIFVLAIAFVLMALSNAKEKMLTGYVETNDLYENYSGKRVLEKKFKKFQEEHQKELSEEYNKLIELAQNLDEKVGVTSEVFRQKEMDFNRKSELFEHRIDSTQKMYISQMWIEINQKVRQYGNENGYHYIFGANGEGNLMYAQEGMNLTTVLIKYINENTGVDSLSTNNHY